jgi:hypothetical protein
MNDLTEGPSAPPEWIADLEQSEAELAAGLTVSSESIHEMIRACLARMAANPANSEPTPRA